MRDFLHIFIIINFLFNFIFSSALRVRRENMKVQITAKGHTIMLKFMPLNIDTKLEGYILGYGSSMFSKQFIQLPKNGEPYETEIDAEPKYLIAVKQVRANEVKKQCTEEVNLETPLHLVIGSVTPTSVLLSWGTLLKTPYTETNMDDCIEEGEFTVRYKENETSQQWNYQTCPTTSTIIENLKPDTPYEFGVRAGTDAISGDWSPPVIHTTADVDIHDLFQPKNQRKPQEPIIKAPQVFLPPVPVLHNITQSRPAPLLRRTGPPPIPRRALGTGGDITPHEDPLSLSQTLSFSHTTTSQTPSITTNIFQTQQSTLRSTTSQQHQHYHTAQFTTSTTKSKSHTTEIQSRTTPTTTKISLSNSKTPPSTTDTQPSTTITNLSTTETPTSTTESQLGTPEIVCSKIKINTNHPKTNDFQLQPTTTQSLTNIIQKKASPFQTHVRSNPQTTPQPTSLSRSRTTQQIPIKAHLKHITTAQTRPNTTKSQPIITTPQPGKRQPSTVQLKVTTSQSMPDATPQKSNPSNLRTTKQNNSESQQNQSTTPQSQLSTTKPMLVPVQTQPQKSITKQQTSTAQFQFMTTQPKSTTAHLTPQMPRTSQSRNMQQKYSAVQPLTRTIQQQITTQSALTLPQSWTNQKLQQPTTSRENIYITKQQHTLINRQPTHESMTKSIMFQHTTSQYPPYDTHNTPSTIEIITRPWKPPQTPTTFQHQPVPDQAHQPTSSTIQYHYTTQWQYDKSDSILKSTLQATNTPHSTTKQVPYASIQPFNLNLEPTAKSNTNQNSSWAERQSEAVNKKVPGSKAAPSQAQDGQSSPKPAHVREVTKGPDILSNISSYASKRRHSVIKNGTTKGRIPEVPFPSRTRVPPTYKNTSLKREKALSGEKHKGLLMPKPSRRPSNIIGLPKKNPRPTTPIKKTANQVEKPMVKAHKVINPKQEDTLLIMKPQATPATEKNDYPNPTPTTKALFVFNGSRFDTGDNSSVFSSVPVSDVDAMGKKRFVAPHVIYKTDKRPEEPCSVTHSLSFFPDEEVMNINVTGPPKSPPTNLTVVTVEGCPSFVILDWEKGDNETTEYEVTSSTKGPNGKPVSVQITDQTHTTVENLKPESSYEFTVTPKNELGSGPPSEPVTFNTESADPRVSEITTGKNAIWSSFPFKADSYSECNGRQYVKRTWYRKFVGIQLCNSLRYKIYLSDSLKGKFYNIGDQSGYGEDHCQFVDSFLDGRTGGPLPPDQLPSQEGYFRAVRQEPVKFGLIGGSSHINYVAWYECGIPIPGSW